MNQQRKDPFETGIEVNLYRSLGCDWMLTTMHVCQTIKRWCFYLFFTIEDERTTWKGNQLKPIFSSFRKLSTSMHFCVNGSFWVNRRISEIERRKRRRIAHFCFVRLSCANNSKCTYAGFARSILYQFCVCVCYFSYHIILSIFWFVCYWWLSSQPDRTEWFIGSVHPIERKFICWIMFRSIRTNFFFLVFGVNWMLTIKTYIIYYLISVNVLLNIWIRYIYYRFFDHCCWMWLIIIP